MAGYNGWSMSNNAVECYDNNIKPMSKWKKNDILECVGEIYGIDVYKISNKLNLAELKDTFLVYDSWHHTSNRFNKTSFYRFDDEKEIDVKFINNIISGRVKKEKAVKIETPNLYITALVKYDQWEGSRNHPKKVTYETVVNYRSNDKLIDCGSHTKRLSSLTILKSVSQKTKYAADKRVLKNKK